MNDIITVATLAATLGIAPRLVQYRAKRLGVEKTSGIYLFTPEQADAIRQYKTKPGPAPGGKRKTMKSQFTPAAECRSCGRQFDDLTDEEIQANECPAADCPSHWEEKGVPHPDFPLEKQNRSAPRD